MPECLLLMTMMVTILSVVASDSARYLCSNRCPMARYSNMVCTTGSVVLPSACRRSDLTAFLAPPLDSISMMVELSFCLLMQT